MNKKLLLAVALLSLATGYLLMCRSSYATLSDGLVR